ncbi:MAG: MSMEG_0570 family nitrogen starvation response protein [Cyanobacteria bacterium P01_F01_bin.33]
MPEMHFYVEWPDGKQVSYYSPSLVVKKYFEISESYSISDFLERSRESLNIASDRVKAKFGFPCSLAMGSLQSIERAAAEYGDRSDGMVKVIQFTE